jgi:hypothetical protein
MAKFCKGQSGNPGGRPKVIGALRDLARQHAPEAISELARIATKGKSEAARIAAIRELLDRGYGKPTQPVSGDGEDSAPIDHKFVVEFISPKPDPERADRS